VSASDRLRITAQLVDASTGNHSWAERYDRDVLDLFAIQDEITSKIVAWLAGQLSASGFEKARRKRPGSLAADDYWLRSVERTTRSAGDDLARQWHEVARLQARCLSRLRCWPRPRLLFSGFGAYGNAPIYPRGQPSSGSFPHATF
jgi:hypothetical protein